MQYLYYSGEYSKCRTYINEYKREFLNDTNLYEIYYALSEYHLGHKNRFYSLINEYFKRRPYHGNLVASRSTLKVFMDDSSVLKILERYYSEDEINQLKNTILKENKIHETFLQTNKSLSVYFATRDTRLTAL